jgi:hypothetical protein
LTQGIMTPHPPAQLHLGLPLKSKALVYEGGSRGVPLLRGG